MTTAVLDPVSRCHVRPLLSTHQRFHHNVLLSSWPAKKNVTVCCDLRTPEWRHLDMRWYMMFLQCVTIGLPVQHLQCPFQQEEQNIDVSNQSEPLPWDDWGSALVIGSPFTVNLKAGTLTGAEADTFSQTQPSLDSQNEGPNSLGWKMTGHHYAWLKPKTNKTSRDFRVAAKSVLTSTTLVDSAERKTCRERR